MIVPALFEPRQHLSLDPLKNFRDPVLRPVPILGPAHTVDDGGLAILARVVRVVLCRLVRVIDGSVTHFHSSKNRRVEENAGGVGYVSSVTVIGWPIDPCPLVVVELKASER